MFGAAMAVVSGVRGGFGVEIALAEHRATARFDDCCVKRPICWRLCGLVDRRTGGDAKQKPEHKISYDKHMFSPFHSDRILRRFHKDVSISCYFPFIDDAGGAVITSTPRRCQKFKSPPGQRRER